MGKAVMDALNKVLWDDDNQVTGLMCFKHWLNLEGNDEAGVWVEARELH